jgi:acetyl-CoA carboxylase biotin carboxylase subunit
MNQIKTPHIFRKVLIANRGEIAVRIIRCLREMGIRSVALYSDADQHSRHRFMADEAVRLPGNTSAETYLRVDRIIAAIQNTGADAVHPGYGFLSENADFAEAIAATGATFIGPSPSAMHRMGDKVAARKLMREARVPIVPGSDDPLRTWEELRDVANEISYPLIIKAAAGGGGRGMRVVRKDSELEAAFQACTREAQDYFGNPEIFCERFIEHGRHIEIQVLGDRHGHAVHLFERDCTVQRRHQKLIEEAPSQFLNDAQRTKLGEIAVRAAKAVDYCGAGTIEFICESPDQCYFMEMNTRIQVEHPVTEMITGIDLIREQILVAAGLPLSFTQDEITPRGWAIELRINAEDPLRGFAPCPGLVSELQLPSGPNVRVDTHLYAGYQIPAFYDSMVAKLIVHGRDRDDAIRKILRALSELKISGVITTAAFHEQVLQDPDFLSGVFTTRYVDEKGEALIKNIYAHAPTPNMDEALSIIAAHIANTTRTQLPTGDDRLTWQHIANTQHAGRGLQR